MAYVKENGARFWQISCFVSVIISICLLIALVFVVVKHDNDNEKTVYVYGDNGNGALICGESGSNPNGNFIDLSEPTEPGPFHDLTTEELVKLRTFLENYPAIRASPMDPMPNLSSSYIYLADLWVPPKSEVLAFLDSGGPQPPRQARVMMFRGDKSPPVVEEWICGPLPDVTSCGLMNLPNNRRNPVEFSSRPLSMMDYTGIEEYVLPVIEEKVGHILNESFQALFVDCEDAVNCLDYLEAPVASGLTGKLEGRLMWLFGLYYIPYPMLHPVDFAVLCQCDGPDPSLWSVVQVWYAGQLYGSLEELAQKYAENSIPKVQRERPTLTPDLYSTLTRRGPHKPPNPQRPPTQVEPDGKRYKLKDRKVDYMDWSFNFRLSPFWGPSLFDIRFQGERIAYELTLSEISVFYSGHSPLPQTTDYVDSGAISGLGSKALVPGGDCPDTATFINYTVMNQHGEEPGVYHSVFCLFEHNNGYPLRRHLEYDAPPFGFYGGMLDSVLTLRSALTVGNYDYLIDFIFHQNGAMETRLMSTGYVQGNVYREMERLYGFQIENGITANLHHHMFHLKADLDVGGTSNRYETLDIERVRTTLVWNSSVPYSQTKFSANLKNTEQEALYRYDIEKPCYHLVYNKDKKSAYNENRAYRLHMTGMSSKLIPDAEGNEKAISWARNQIAVTKHKDHEFRSSSNYGMFDSLDPVVDFSKYYGDNEGIVDEDLVFWLTLGLHHIPHTEDMPVTPTAGNHLTAFLLPHNYFPECPSMGSRDAIFVEHKDQTGSEKGVKVKRHGNSRDQCQFPQPNFEELVKQNPDRVLSVNREAPTF